VLNLPKKNQHKNFLSVKIQSQSEVKKIITEKKSDRDLRVVDILVDLRFVAVEMETESAWLVNL
jgi:hypothetical protein